MSKIKPKECQNVEFKSIWKDEYLKWICGFANAQGAVMYFGVDDDHEVVGLKDSKRLLEDIPNTTAGLQARFAELCEAYRGPIKLHLAAEYMMDALFEERLEQGDLLKLGDEGNQVLVETSYFTPPMDMDAILRRIKQKGIYPMLAHPERYVYMNKERYKELKNNGIRFQLNLSSVAGAYGSEAKDKARWILKQNFYNIAGSDLHSSRNIDYWSTRAPRALKQLFQSWEK